MGFFKPKEGMWAEYISMISESAVALGTISKVKYGSEMKNNLSYSSSKEL